MKFVSWTIACCLLFCFVAVPGWTQSVGTYSLNADQLSIVESGNQLTLTARGNVRFAQNGLTMSCNAATLELSTPPGVTDISQLTPLTLRAQGSLRYSDTAHKRTGSAASATYEFRPERLELRGSVQFAQSGANPLSIKAATVIAAQKIDARGGVTTTLSEARVLGSKNGLSAPLTLRSETMLWNPGDDSLVADGAPVVAVQSDLTMEAPAIHLRFDQGELTELHVEKEIMLRGDLESKGYETTLTAVSATFDPATNNIALAGPITVQQPGANSTATSALLRLGASRSLQLVGMRLSQDLP